jgi:hypothetical protein
MGAVKAAKAQSGASGDGMEWKVVDWDGLERLAGVGHIPSRLVWFLLAVFHFRSSQNSNKGLPI